MRTRSGRLYAHLYPEYTVVPISGDVKRVFGSWYHYRMWIYGQEHDLVHGKWL